VGVKYRLTVLVCDLLLCQQRMEPPPENGLEDGQDDEPPRVLFTFLLEAGMGMGVKGIKIPLPV
jgi:hypothetical protein